MPATPDATGKNGRGTTITIAICTYQRYELLRLAVASCLGQTIRAEAYRILVVDNSPDRARSEEEQARYAGMARVDYVIEGAPGLSHARNVAARRCGTPYIAYLDDDAQASPHWLEGILAGFHLPGVEVGVVGGRIDPRWEIPPPPWLHQDLFGYLSLVDWGGQAPRVAASHEWFAAANIAFRTELIARAGYFNPRLGRSGGGAALLSNEEKDLVSRTEAAGYVRVYAPAASVAHFVAADRLRQAWFRKRVAWQAASEVVMNSEAAAAWAREHAWDVLSDFLAGLPPTLRSLAGLFQPTQDAVQFGRQLNALYAQTLLALTGFEPTS